jgi:hypothetical protein
MFVKIEFGVFVKVELGPRVVCTNKKRKLDLCVTMKSKAIGSIKAAAVFVS